MSQVQIDRSAKSKKAVLPLAERISINGVHLNGTYGSQEVGANGQHPTSDVASRNQLNDLVGREWIAETKSVWFQKGLGAGHDHAQIERQHPAPYSYQDVMRLIRFFTKSGERVLDPFLGVGSTLLLGNRRKFPDAYFDFAVCSPPYWKILTKKADHKVKSERLNHGLAKQYSEESADLGNIDDYESFLDEVCKVFNHCWRVLKPGKYAAIVVGDFRHGGEYIAYHADLIRRLTGPSASPRFDLHGIIILAQNHKRLYPYGYPFAYVPNLHHQYVLILRRPKSRLSTVGRTSP